MPAIKQINNNPVENTFFDKALFNTGQSYAFILNNAHTGQLGYEIAYEIFSYQNSVDKKRKVETIIYTQYAMVPKYWPPMSIFHTKYLQDFKGKAIVFEIDCLIDALRSPHIYEIMFIIHSPNELFQYNQDTLNGIINNDKVKKIFIRSDSYNSLLINKMPLLKLDGILENLSIKTIINEF